MKLRTGLLLVLIGAAFLVLLAACDVNVNAPATTPTSAQQPTLASTLAISTSPANANTPEVAPPTEPPTPAPTATMLSQPPASTPTQAAVAQADTQVPTPIPTPSGTIVDAIAGTVPPTQADTAPSPTAVVATSSGEAITALQAMKTLKPKALSSFPDARLALLVNSKPGQQKSLLGSALGDPNVNEPTPGGKGRNWTLVAVSPSRKGALAISMDGTTVDLVKEGTVPSDLIAQFSAPGLAALDLSTLDPAAMKDSDTVARSAGARGAVQQIGIALLAPNGLGAGPLPTPPSGGNSPQLAYELFSTDPARQFFIFFDALTGTIVLDSGT